MEKEPDSMATVQMKPDYAASEVYSTAGSEAPPAYMRRQSSSVQIAKIIAFTVIASSFILGSFILASSYLQARASCDQMQTLDSVLEKELMLETLQQELPKAEALLQAREINSNDLQNIDKETASRGDEKKSNKNQKDTSESSSETESESDSSFSDSDESADLNQVHVKMPLELNLSELANAILENNQKSRMNCVVERRKAEELVDSPAKTVNLPFGLNLTTDPKKQRVTGERLAIFCESGSETRNEPTEQIHPFIVPIQRFPIPYGPMPEHGPGPLTHMPQQMPPQQMPPQQQQIHQQSPQPQFIVRQFPPQQILRQMHSPPVHQMPPVPDQIMQAPRSEQPQPEVRIQLQRIPLPIRGELSETPVQIREIPLPVNGPHDMPNMPGEVHVQRIPLSVALQRAGITPEDLRNIRQMAEEHIQQELRHLAEDSNNSDSSESSEEESHPSETEQHTPPQLLQMGRSAYGRSLVTPVRIPINMMQQEIPVENPQSDRPHFVQPRSVRSVDGAEKRVKRSLSCNCAC